MSTIVIGLERENVTIHAHKLPRPDRDPDLTMFQANGSFSAGRLQGEFETLFESPRQFADDLEKMSRTLKGEAFWNAIDSDVAIWLKFEERGAIDVEASFRDFRAFEAKIRFGIDQSYLPPIIRSVRSVLQ
jgi:hypothetical protein